MWHKCGLLLNKPSKCAVCVCVRLSHCSRIHNNLCLVSLIYLQHVSVIQADTNCNVPSPSLTFHFEPCSLALIKLLKVQRSPRGGLIMFSLVVSLQCLLNMGSFTWWSFSRAQWPFKQRCWLTSMQKAALYTKTCCAVYRIVICNLFLEIYLSAGFSFSSNPSELIRLIH